MSYLAWEIHVTLISIFAVLAVSNCILFLKMRFSPGSDDTVIRHRLRTWWALAGLFSLALFASPNGGLIFFGFISFFALKEFLSMSAIQQPLTQSQIRRLRRKRSKHVVDPQRRCVRRQQRPGRNGDQ